MSHQLAFTRHKGACNGQGGKDASACEQQGLLVHFQEVKVVSGSAACGETAEVMKLAAMIPMSLFGKTFVATESEETTDHLHFQSVKTT